MTTVKLRRRSTSSPAKTLLIGVVGAGLAAVMTAVMMSSGMIERLLAPHSSSAVAALGASRTATSVVPISTSVKVLGSPPEKKSAPAKDSFVALPTPPEPQPAVPEIAPAVPPLPAASATTQALALAPVAQSFSKQVSPPAADLRPAAPEPVAMAPEPVSTIAKATGPTAAAPEAGDKLSADDADRMTRRAAKLTESGDIAAARALLERPARAGFGPAIYKLAETYDPRVLAQWGARGIKGDLAKARDLYTKALQGGVVEARDRLGDIDRGTTPKTAVLGER